MNSNWLHFEFRICFEFRTLDFKYRTFALLHSRSPCFHPAWQSLESSSAIGFRPWSGCSSFFPLPATKSPSATPLGSSRRFCIGFSRTCPTNQFTPQYSPFEKPHTSPNMPFSACSFGERFESPAERNRVHGFGLKPASLFSSSRCMRPAMKSIRPLCRPARPLSGTS